MNNNNTAADREKAVNGKTMQAMNEQYKNHYPQLKPIKDLTFCCDEIWTFSDSDILEFYRHPDEWEQQIFGSQ